MRLEPFLPGRAPCGDDCALEWAAGEAGVPVGAPVPMIIPAGTVITTMTSAGPTHADVAMFAVDELEGVGYHLGDGAVFFRANACGNWLTAHLQETDMATFHNHAHVFTSGWGGSSSGGSWGGFGGSGSWGGGTGNGKAEFKDAFLEWLCECFPGLKKCESIVEVPSEPGGGGMPGGDVAPVPLPASALLLIGACLCFMFATRKTRRRHRVWA